MPLTAAEHPEHIEAEDYADETESAYENGLRQYENGRRYHSFKKGTYFLPNDESENDRLDLCHHMITLRLGGRLHLAPIASNVQEILDLGTGTGIWAIHMGDEYEAARVLGNDLSPIQPGFVPPNVRFEIDDVEDEWAYTQRFDFIHARYLLGAIKDWPRLVAQCFRCLKPGGWLELQEFTMDVYSTDGSLREDSYMTRYMAETSAGMRAMGVDPEPGPKLAAWVKEAGFEHVRNERFAFPIGSWPKDATLKQVGLLNLANFVDGLEGFSMRLLTGLRGWKKEEVEAHVAHTKKELRTRSIHPQYDMYDVYAQKPLDAE